MASVPPLMPRPDEEPGLNSLESGPKGTRSLRVRGSPLAPPAAQRRILDTLSLTGEFAAALRQCGWSELRPASLEIFQTNVGRLCNMTCRHCHVDAGPDRTAENMDGETIELCLGALDRTTAHTVDITGGAPELNPHFRYLVEQCVARGKHVIDRCNLTILLLPRFADLPAWLGERGVEVVCSLPHYRRRNTDAQRGDGAFDKSIEALRLLNSIGYGRADSPLRLNLVYNPAGAFLPGPQRALEADFHRELQRRYGVVFHSLYTITNMPINRFLEFLHRTGNYDRYMEKLVNAYNPGAAAGVMCRYTLSVGWDGTLYDCDFNQMLDLPLDHGAPRHIRDFRVDLLHRRPIVTGPHCYGCTAGSGSSCGGTTVSS